ncbi:hypothetical protein Agub_g14614 [Astrephomene gubernaculifera]|uniref:Uncharacterized protein n=1 Tax=Astrephomene gubernaculifera TaxID=47775 RepID=A0AAD3HT85_9CHLO|nr:hypothetical protein Agub_g14614 [Astrephomene gubernaculifera]
MSSAHILSTFQSTFPGLYQSQQGSDEGTQEQADASPLPLEKEQDGGHDPYNARIAGITSKFERLRASADEMEQYLRTAAEEAKEAEARALAKADEEFTPGWRNVGLPLKPSHLQLDGGTMAGARLVNPKAIVQEYHAIKRHEVLNPPRIAEYADTSARPTYLKSTHTLDVRKTRTLSPERLARVHQIAAKHLTWHTLTPDEVAARMEEAEERRRLLSLKMPRAQFEREQRIIQSMHHKLTFLRNPRHPLPPAVKMLMEQRPEAQRWAGPRAEVRHGVEPPIKANMTARDDVIFVVEPAEVMFTDYAVGRTYEKLVRVRNVTAVCRGLRIFPPASQYFHVSLPRFPGESGVLAPGMAAELTLRFCPDSLGDYEDALGVDTSHTGLRLTVPLRARRPPPSLTLPEEIEMGQVVIGNVKTEQVAFRNLGGPGRFRIVPEADWPDFAQDAPTDRAVIGPFKIWPLCFEMATNEEIALNVSYEPVEWGNSEERLVLVCDNCQVKTFSLLGNGVSVDVLLHSVDGRMLEPRELDLPLWFGEVAPRSGFSKTVSVRNTTKLPFAFEWALTRFPQVQHKRRANEPLQTEQQYDEEQEYDEGHVLLVDNKAMRGGGTGRPGLPSASASASSGLPSTSGNGGVFVSSGATQQRPGQQSSGESSGTPWGVISGSGAHGPDPLALGAVVENVFTVVPQRGVLQPGEVMEFLFTFTPPACERYERWAQLRVDRAPVALPSDGSGILRGSGNGTGSSHAAIAAAATCDVLVTEVGLEGLGRLVQLQAHPRLVSVPGVLMPKQRAVRRVELRNPTRARVDVRVVSDHPAVSIEPSALTLPPLGSSYLKVTLTAPETPGQLTARATVEPQHGHGPPVPLLLQATVGASRAELRTSRLDFGLVRLGCTAERPLVIRNCSSTCHTAWSVREITEAVIAAEKAQLLRTQLLQSVSMLDPLASAAAQEAIEQRFPHQNLPQTPSTQPGADLQQPPQQPEQEEEEQVQERQGSAGLEVSFGFSVMGGGGGGGGSRNASPSRTSRGPSRLTTPSTPRRGSKGSGSASSSASSGIRITHLTFQPSSGVLAPGEELTIRVTCHALTDGRSRAIIQLRSGTAALSGSNGTITSSGPAAAASKALASTSTSAGAMVHGLDHIACIESFVCAVTPTCVIDRPVLDLGVTFVGVQVRQFLYMTNLSQLPLEFRWSSESADSPETGALADLRVKPEKGQLAPGEEVEVQVRYTPRAVGQSVMYGVCELDGAPRPLGFRVTSTIQSLDVTYDLLTQEEYDEMQAAAETAPPKVTIMAAAAAAQAAEEAEEDGEEPPPGPLPEVSYFKRGRNGRPEVDIEIFAGMTNLPPEVLTRISAGRTGSTTTASGTTSTGGGDSRSLEPRRSFRRRTATGPGWPPPAPSRHLVADFGKNVPLGETRQMYLVVTNRTAMHTSMRTWLERFGVEDAARFTRRRTSPAAAVAGGSPAGEGGRGNGSGGAHGRGAVIDRRESGMSGGGESETAAGASGLRIRTSKYTPIKLISESDHTPFRAARGNEMMATRRLQEEADQALGDKGLAVSVTPPECTLAPWSHKVLSLSCFNDMCGAYMDMLHVKVGDLPPRDIPVLVGVTGTPLVVQRERVLVKGLRERSWRASLEWGQVPRGVEQQRTFYVFNTGSLDMHVSWQMLRYHEYPDLEKLPPTTDVGSGGTGYHDSLYGGPGRLRDTRAQYKMYDLKLEPDERAGAVRVVATRHGDPDDGPFRVEPTEQVIRGGGSAKFTVSFSASPEATQTIEAYLHGACRVFSPEAAVQLRLWPRGESGDGVGVLLSGAFHPYAGAPPTPLQPLRVDLQAMSVPSRLEPDGVEQLAWRVASIHQPLSHPSFVRSVTLSNTQACPQVFSLGVEGPWDLLAATPSIPQDPVAYRGTSTLLGPAVSSGLLGANAADGGLVFLPPRESVDVTLRFVPGKGDLEALPVRFAAMQARQRVVETTTDYKNTGALTVSFSNGDTQSLQLVAEMLHPRLEVRPRKLNFGHVHLLSPMELLVELSNPTSVDAAWAVTVEGVKPRFPTLPGAGAAASAQAEAAVGGTGGATSSGAASSGAASAGAGGGGSSTATHTPRSGRSSTTGGPVPETPGTHSRSSSVASSRAAAANAVTTATLAAAGQSLSRGVTAVSGGVPPPLRQPAVTAALAGVTGIIAEARIGPYIVRPASGVLPGRGLRLPHTQKISITFAPTEAGAFDGELIFAVLRGKDCSVDIDGIGSIDEADEHKGKLFVI